MMDISNIYDLKKYVFLSVYQQLCDIFLMSNLHDLVPLKKALEKKSKKKKKIN